VVGSIPSAAVGRKPGARNLAGAKIGVEGNKAVGPRCTGLALFVAVESSPRLLHVLKQGVLDGLLGKYTCK